MAHKAANAVTADVGSTELGFLTSLPGADSCRASADILASSAQASTSTASADVTATLTASTTATTAATSTSPRLRSGIDMYLTRFLFFYCVLCLPQSYIL